MVQLPSARINCIMSAGEVGRAKVLLFPGASAMVWALLGAAACGGGGSTSPDFPLVEVTDVELPGKAVRFDYEDIDPGKGHLIIAHMNDASVVVVKLSDGSTVKVLPDIPTARGVIVGDDV